MGLDITVHRLKKKAKNYITKFDDFPDWAKELVTFKTLKFYDWKEYSKLTGIDYDDCPLQEAFDDKWDNIVSDMNEIQKLMNYSNEIVSSSANQVNSSLNEILRYFPNKIYEIFSIKLK